MEFYIVEQDQRISNYSEPIGMMKVFSRDLLNNIDDGFEGKPVMFYIKEKPDTRYIDFIQNPFPLVSDKFKKIIEEYQITTLFKPVILADKKAMSQHLYWIPAPRRFQCLSHMTEFNKDNSVKKLVINVENSFRENVFMIDGIVGNFLIVSREVAERLLREEFEGIALVRIEKEMNGFW